LLGILLAGGACAQESAETACPAGYGAYEVVDVPQVGKFCLDDNPSAVKIVFRSGKPWAPFILDQVRKHAAPGTTAVDVGAHIGSIAVPMARAVGRDGAVYAFEPEAKSYAELVANVALNELDNVRPQKVALGSEAGMVSMRTTPVDGISWVAEDATGEQAKSAATNAMRALEKLPEVKTVEDIELRTLDSYGLEEVSFIKIDVEGYAVPILRGASETIRKWHPVIVIELSQKEHDEGGRKLLESAGYALEAISSTDYLAVWQAPR
jgi:FkbM family methyltransferase